MDGHEERLVAQPRGMTNTMEEEICRNPFSYGHKFRRRIQTAALAQSNKIQEHGVAAIL